MFVKNFLLPSGHLHIKPPVDTLFSAHIKQFDAVIEHLEH
jgi:hypothetical protein